MAAPVFSQIMRYALHRYGIADLARRGDDRAARPSSVPFPQRPRRPSSTDERPRATTTPATTTPATTIVASRPGTPRKGRDRPGGSPTVRMDRLLEEVEVIEAHGDPAGTEVTVHRIRQPTCRARRAVLLSSRSRSATATTTPPKPWPGAPRPAGRASPGPGRDPGRGGPGDGPRRHGADGVRLLRSTRPASLLTVGVTGTNGKTTVTHLLASIFEAHGWPSRGHRHARRRPDHAGVPGAAAAPGRGPRGRPTAPWRWRCPRTPSPRHGSTGSASTPPCSPTCRHDHLDYHGTMEAYFAAKASLFTPERAGAGRGQRRRRLGPAAPRRGRASPPWDYSMDEASDVDSSARHHTSFTWRGRRVELALTGSFHVANALAAATTAAVLGVPEDVIVAGLHRASPVPGRFEVVDTGGPVHRRRRLRPHPRRAPGRVSTAPVRWPAGHRVLCVFGCGGDRDHEKRPAMGAVAAARCRRRRGHVGQPAQRGPRRHHRRGPRGCGRQGREVVVRPDRPRPSSSWWTWPRPGTWWWWPGKGHERTSRSGASACLSTTARWRRAAVAGGPGGQGGQEAPRTDRDQPHGLGRHRPVGRRAGDAAAHPVAGPQADRTADPRGRPLHAPGQGGHAHHGGLALVVAAVVGYLMAHAGTHVAFSRPGVLVVRGDGVRRRGRVPRRLDQGAAPPQPGAQQAGQARRPGGDRRRFRPPGGALGRGEHPPVVHPLGLLRDRPGSGGLGRVGGGDHRGHGQRREPHRRARRARLGIGHLLLRLPGRDRLLAVPALLALPRVLGARPGPGLGRPGRARVWASCGGTPHRRGSSWATPGRWPSARAWPRCACR